MSEASHGVAEHVEMIAVVLRIRIRGQEVLIVVVREAMVDYIFPDPDTVDAVQKQPDSPYVRGPAMAPLTKPAEGRTQAELAPKGLTAAQLRVSVMAQVRSQSRSCVSHRRSLIGFKEKQALQSEGAKDQALFQDKVRFLTEQKTRLEAEKLDNDRKLKEEQENLQRIRGQEKEKASKNR